MLTCDFHRFLVLGPAITVLARPAQEYGEEYVAAMTRVKPGWILLLSGCCLLMRPFGLAAHQAFYDGKIEGIARGASIMGWWQSAFLSWEVSDLTTRREDQRLHGFFC